VTSPRRDDLLGELFRNPLDPGYADAAARRAAGHRPPPGTRAALRGGTLVVLVVLGFLFAVAYRQTLADAPRRTATRAALAEQVQTQRTTTDALQARADQLRSQVVDLRARELGGVQAARLRNLEGATGVSRVRGDGVKVTVGDGHPTISPKTGKQTDDGRVRDFELQQIANSLWAVGAEAVAVNGQRLTATSTIREAGEAVLVDFRPVTSPYEVVAIGPAQMREAFGRSPTAGAFRQLARQIGMTFDVADAGTVTLAAASEPNLRFATPSPTVAVRPSGRRSATSSTPSEGGR
jgi:uncharacterized protein YlxW (UPF0749 family)